MFWIAVGGGVLVLLAISWWGGRHDRGRSRSFGWSTPRLPTAPSRYGVGSSFETGFDDPIEQGLLSQEIEARHGRRRFWQRPMKG